MPNFKIGDKVRRIKSEHGGMQVNDIGTVKFVTSSGAIELQERAYNVKMWDNAFNVTHDADNFELVESPARHPHADTIIAWVNGAKIQYKSYDNNWYDHGPSAPIWNECIEFRVKPEIEPDKIVYMYILRTQAGGILSAVSNQKDANLVLTFDPVTNKIKTSEVI